MQGLKDAIIVHYADGQVGDASACQSPISFGGFGSMLRHLPRLTDGISETLAIDRLDRSALALLQPYQPSLSASWLFQRFTLVSLFAFQSLLFAMFITDNRGPKYPPS